MKTLRNSAIAMIMTVTPVMADPLGVVLQSDGPWIDLPDGVMINAAAPTLDDILLMADLDGDPTVTTAEEEQMIALLSSVLLTAPISY